MRDGDEWVVEGATYRRDGEKNIFIVVADEKDCETCATHRRLHAKMAEKDIIKTWPMGEPLCTWHMNMRYAKLDAIDFARQLAAMPRLVDQLQG